MRPGDHIDRIELDHANPLDNPPQVPDIYLAGWTRIGQALGGQGDSASLSNI
jgi:hypothetical protein